MSDSLFLETSGAMGGFDGYGENSGRLVAFQNMLEAKKSLEAGEQVPASGGGSGAPLLAQSVEDTMKVVTARDGHANFWRKFPKDTTRIKNITHEWRRQTSLGDDLSGFSAEGSVGPMVTSTFGYEHATVKYITHKREITDALNALTGAIGGPALQTENKNASTYFGRTLNNNLLWGNASVNDLAFDGIAQTCVNAGRVLDMEGGMLDTEAMLDRVVGMVNPPNFGSPNEIWISYDTQNDLNKLQIPHIRYTGDTGGNVNLSRRATGLLAPVPGMDGNDDDGGFIGFKRDVYMAPSFQQLLVLTGLGEVIPATPTAGVAFAAVALAGGETSKFKSGDADDYLYWVKAVGAKGKSAVLASSAITVAANQKVTVTIANPGTTDVLYYELYRSEKNGLVGYKIGETKKGATTTLITDFNFYRPNTSWAFVMEKNAEVMEWKQIVDFFVRPLAQTELRIPLVYGIYGMPCWFKPERMFAVKNIGAAH